MAELHVVLALFADDALTATARGWGVTGAVVNDVKGAASIICLYFLSGSQQSPVTSSATLACSIKRRTQVYLCPSRRFLDDNPLSCNGRTLTSCHCTAPLLLVESDTQVSCCESDSWSVWGSWRSCSTLCGSGITLRSRNCCGSCSGSSSESATCNEGSQKEWTLWSEWSACSAQCGTGFATRLRQCEGCWGSCAGNSEDSKSCLVSVSASWTAWLSWSTCSTQCGEGTRSRRRTCTGECEGDCPLGTTEEDRDPCQEALPREWTAWGEWSACEGCGTGLRRRERRCMGTCEGSCEENASEVDSEACPDEPAEWSAWSNYSACTAVCGEGQQTRLRTCEGGVVARLGGSCACGNFNFKQNTFSCQGIARAAARRLGAPRPLTRPVRSLQQPYRDRGASGVSANAEQCREKVGMVLSGVSSRSTSSNAGSCAGGLCGQGNRTRARNCSAGCPSSECSISREVHTEIEACQVCCHGSNIGLPPRAYHGLPCISHAFIFRPISLPTTRRGQSGARRAPMTAAQARRAGRAPAWACVCLTRIPCAATLALPTLRPDRATVARRRCGMSSFHNHALVTSGRGPASATCAAMAIALA